jgi:glutamate dehydrogenase/leucine dehydrogenase
MTKESALDTARSQLRRAVELLQLSENDWQTLSTPRRILEVAVPLRRDNGAFNTQQLVAHQRAVFAFTQILIWKKLLHLQCS